MSYSRYAIEKKQISQDRGVTWTDVDPSETRYGSLVGVYRTLIECEDADCELEKTEYTVIEGVLPNEFCGDMISILPSGIAEMVSWTAGAICCNTWQTAHPTTTDRYGTVTTHDIGSPYCIKDSPSYCPSFNYSSTYVEGSEMTDFCFEVQQVYGWSCPATLCACFTIDSFMPWAEGKTSWKLVQAQHYVREHCSEAWVEDGEPYICGIAERWKYVDETFEYERWIHQVAKRFDDNGNVVEWESEGNLIYRNMTEATLDPNIEILDYVINDGVICWASSESDRLFENKLNIQIARDTSYSLSGNLFTCEDYFANSSDSYGVTTSGGTDYITGVHVWQYGFEDTPKQLTNKLTTYQNAYGSDGTFWIGVFCGFSVGPESQTSPVYKITTIDDILSGTKCGKILSKAGTTIAFPCRIHESLGQSDDYWNSSKIGYVFRNGDGTMTVMETLKLEEGQLVKEHPDWTA